MLGKNLLRAVTGAGTASGPDITEVFGTWLYTGNGSTQTITNGIDLAGEGGLVWIKSRGPTTYNHCLIDSERGISNGNILYSNTSSPAQFDANAGISSLNADGFTLRSDSNGYGTNYAASGDKYVSWTFRKAPGFFDVVTYVGDGVAGRTVAHNLGSVPGCIIVKSTSSTIDWQVYHRSTGATQNLVLNSTAAANTSTIRWNNTEPTASVFTLGSGSQTNADGETYVAYLFAHDEQIFGEAGDQSVIKCGSYTGNGSTAGPTVTLGWEPQWILLKNVSLDSNWIIYDTMRGVPVGYNPALLYPNTSDAELAATWAFLDLTTQGFQLKTTDAWLNRSGDTYAYIAIRRGPMKTPTSGTEVFNTELVGGEETTPFPVDSNWISRVGNAGSASIRSRLTGGLAYLNTSLTSAEAQGLDIGFDDMTGVRLPGYFAWNFRRAPGFFDVVAYTGTSGSASKAHNLHAIPELIIVKVRNANGTWFVYSSPTGSSYLALNTTASVAGSGTWTTPASSAFTAFAGINDPNENYIAYLFASCPGVSKCFGFTGNGTSQTIDCGFASGARFVLLKRTDSTGNWLVADTARGIVSGNDPLLYLNSTAAEITTADWIDPASSGFTVVQEATANANVSGASYIGLAIS